MAIGSKYKLTTKFCDLLLDIGVYTFAFVRLILRILGPVCVIFASTLIFVVSYTYYSYVYPAFLDNEDLPIFFNPHTFISAYFLFNIYANYFFCCLTHSGSPPLKCVDPTKVFGRKSYLLDGKKYYEANTRLDIVPGVSYRYCKHCNCIKPPRAHHCRS